MTVAQEPAVEAPSSKQLPGKYLTFILAGESYAIPVLKVREIIRAASVRPVPGLPEYVRGVINLRGRIIPVIDLRLRFGLTVMASTDQTCIVVVQVRTATSRSTQMGLIVDGVEEVAQIAAGDMEETPDFGAQIATDYLLGLAKIKGAVKAILDIDRAVGGAAGVDLTAS